MHQALRPVLLLLLAPQLAAVSHTRLSRRAAVASSVLCSSLVVLPRAVASSAVLCSSLLLPRAAEASEFQTAESATASQFAAAEAARASRQRDSFERRRAFELKVSAVQDATTAREFVVAKEIASWRCKIPEWKKGKAVRESTESHLKKDPNLRRCL